MQSFHLPNLDLYCRDYSQLGQALGVAEAKPAPGELDFLRGVTRPGRFGFGLLEHSDIFFAAAVTSILRPRITLEIGTASGFSAAIIAKAMALRLAESGYDSGAVLVHTIDKNSTFSPDRSKPIGFGIGLMTPELRDRIALHPLRESSYCREIINQGQATLGFIDGNHRHPWPLSDLLQLLGVIESGWILLHDIDLPGLVERVRGVGKTTEVQPVAGAQLIFKHWPGRKISCGNIGGIQVPIEQESLGAFVSRLRQLPGEVSPGSWIKQWRTIDALLDPPPRRRWGWR
jgi:hypothetical protein